MGQQPRVSTAVQGLGSETSLGFLMARDQGFSRTINAHVGFNGITATGLGQQGSRVLALKFPSIKSSPTCRAGSNLNFGLDLKFKYSF